MAPVSTPTRTQSPQLLDPPRRSSSHSTAEALTAKPRTRKVVFGNAKKVTRTEKVSIFADKTLRRGDAVMMATGMRIFAGSNSWPYRSTDFIALADAPRLNRGQQAILLDLDRFAQR